MGKKSKRRTTTTSTNSTTNNNTVTEQERTEALLRARTHPDKPIPRVRHLYPEDWKVNIACIHPFRYPEYQYVCVDAELYIDKQTDNEIGKKNRAKVIQHYSDCPICFKDATLTCSRCGTVSYCSGDCQKQHWKLSHKKACQPNPNPYKFKLKLKLFQGLTEDCFEGHEFLIVKPTEQLTSLQQICDHAIESADDLLDTIPGFGANQLNPDWLQANNQHPVYQQMLKRFGFTSGYIGLEPVYGYRVAEAKFMFFCWCDDSFQTQTDLLPSYYGKALFPPLPQGKSVRGNIVIYKLILKSKRRKPPQQNNPIPFLQLQLSDDADLEFEFILAPTNKAELAYMISERCKAMEQNAYTTRMWRYPIRKAEMELEN